MRPSPVLIRTAACLLSVLCGLPLLAAKNKEGPEIRLVVFDRNLNMPISNFQSEIRKITSKETKQDSFIYTVIIRKTNYNPYTASLTIPTSTRASVWFSTNYLTPYLSLPAAPPPPKFTSVVVSGVVRDISGRPIPNVMVQLFDENMALLREHLTAADGRYAFSNVPPRTYTIRSESTKDLIERKAERQAPSPSSAPGPVPVSPIPAVASTDRIVPEPSKPVYPALDSANVDVLSAENGILVLKHDKADDIKGMAVAFKSGTNRFFVTPFDTITTVPESSANVWSNRTITLEGKSILFQGRPLFTDGVRFDLYLYAVYRDGAVSPAALRMENLETRDVVPPALPCLDRVALLSNAILFRWHRLTADNEPLAYRIYRKQTNGYAVVDEIRDYTTNSSTERLLRLKPGGTTVTDSVFTVTSIDRFGNESEFQRSFKTVTLASNQNIDVVLDTSLGPPVFFEKPRPPVITPPRVYSPFEQFVRNGYTLAPGAVLTIRNRGLVLPRGTRVTVGRRARLVLENVTLSGRDAAVWAGLFVDAGTLDLRNVVVTGAATGISVVRSGRLSITGGAVVRCGTGIAADDAWITLRNMSVSRCILPLRADRTHAVLESVRIVTNADGPVFTSCPVNLVSCRVEANRDGIVLRQCTGLMSLCRIVRNAGDGLVLASSMMAANSCIVSSNSRNGVVCEGSLPEIRSCDLEGNGFYAIRDGGRVIGCFVSANNRSSDTDNTPDHGTADGRLYSFSNSSIRQIYAADLIRGLSAIKITIQEK